MNKRYLAVKRWREKHPEACLEIRRRNRRMRNNRCREIINREKTRPCFDCGIQYSPWIMEYDHRNPVEKKFVIGSVTNISVSMLMQEINKCDVVCANCHKDRTHKLRLRRKCWQDVTSG